MINKTNNSFFYSAVMWIFTFFLLYLSSSFSLSKYDGTTRMTLYLIYFIILFLYGLLTKRICFRINFILVLLIILGVVSYLVNFESIKSIVLLISYFAIVFAFISIIKIDVFLKSYNSVLYVVSFVAIILYIINIVNPSIIEFLPTDYNSGKLIARTTFICLAPINNRSCGFFWEPGAYQFYLIIALLIELFTRQTKKRYLFVFIGALLTTFSTAGYISFVFLLLAYTIYAIKNKETRKTFGSLVLLSLIGILVGYYLVINNTPSLYNVLIGKVEKFIISGESYSTRTRVDAFFGAFKIGLQNPLFGVGITKLNSIFFLEFGHMQTINTYANWLAMFGVGFFVIMIYGILLFSNYLTKHKIACLAVFITILLSLSSENFSLNPSVLIFPMYALMMYKENTFFARSSLYEKNYYCVKRI